MFDADSDAGSKPDKDPVRFVSFQTFAARIFERGMLKGPILAIGTIERALENVKKDTSQERNAFVKAASQWLLLQGDVVYAEVTDGRLSQKKWQGWHERLSAVAAGEAESRNVSFDPEAIELAGKAIVAMEALERQKAG